MSIAVVLDPVQYLEQHFTGLYNYLKHTFMTLHFSFPSRLPHPLGISLVLNGSGNEAFISSPGTLMYSLIDSQEIVLIFSLHFLFPNCIPLLHSKHFFFKFLLYTLQILVWKHFNLAKLYKLNCFCSFFLLEVTISCFSFTCLIFCKLPCCWLLLIQPKDNHLLRMI